MGDESVGDRVRALRKALDITQSELSSRAGFPDGNPVYVSKVETGINALGSLKARVSLARGFGLTPGQFDLYLGGGASLSETVALARGAATAESRDPEPEFERPRVSDDEDAFGAALLWSLDREKHTIHDLDAVRVALRGTAQMRDPDADLVAAARTWLDAAARLRRAGKPVTIETLLLEVTLGSKLAAVSPSAKALQADTDAEWQSHRDARQAKDK